MTVVTVPPFGLQVEVTKLCNRFIFETGGHYGRPKDRWHAALPRRDARAKIWAPEPDGRDSQSPYSPYYGYYNTGHINPVAGWKDTAEAFGLGELAVLIDHMAVWCLVDLPEPRQGRLIGSVKKQDGIIERSYDYEDEGFLHSKQQHLFHVVALDPGTKVPAAPIIAYACPGNGIKGRGW